MCVFGRVDTTALVGSVCLRGTVSHGSGMWSKSGVSCCKAIQKAADSLPKCLTRRDWGALFGASLIIVG